MPNLRRFRRVCALLGATFSFCLLLPAAEPENHPVGSGRLEFTVGPWHLPVWYHRPTGHGPTDPIVFVMHGVQRNADDYRDQWRDLAEQYQVLLVVPEYSREQFPGAAGYNLGNVLDQQNAPQPPDRWSYATIEPLFDLIRDWAGSTRERYHLYGHSAGAQFVHRFLYFVPDARVDQVVSANAGWYTLPDETIDFPYGLRGAPVPHGGLRRALTRPVTVLLGTADTDPAHPSLRHTPEAEAQGAHRLARGEYFFQAARSRADVLNVDFGWRLAYAPDIAHDNAGMASFAARWLFDIRTTASPATALALPVR